LSKLKCIAKVICETPQYILPELKAQEYKNRPITQDAKGFKFINILRISVFRINDIMPEKF